MAARNSKSPADLLEEMHWREKAVTAPRLTKQAISLRLDADILNYYRSGGRGWQTRINAILRAYVEAQGKVPPSQADDRHL